MPSTNGHGPKRAILYCRVSGEEQARDGYSLSQQMRRLREWAKERGHEVIEEVTDDGWSGAHVERPGLWRVRDLVAAGEASVVFTQDRDRFSRGSLWRSYLEREFELHGVKIRSLNDQGDDSPHGRFTNKLLDDLAELEREITTERSQRGKLEKARQGKVIVGHTPTYGFAFNEARDAYIVDEKTMPIVRRIFRLIAEGMPIYAVKRTLEREGIPTPPTPRKRKHPEEGRRWSKKTIRDIILDDSYKSFSHEEIKDLVKPEVAATLDPQKRYGIWWFNRRRTAHTPISEPDGKGGRRTRKVQKIIQKPYKEWIAVPVPDSGVPRTIPSGHRTCFHQRQPSHLVCRGPVLGTIWRYPLLRRMRKQDVS